MNKENFTVGEYAQGIIAHQGLHPDCVELIHPELREREITLLTARQIALAIGKVHAVIFKRLMELLDGRSEQEIRQLVARTEVVTEKEVGPEIFTIITDMRFMGWLEAGVLRAPKKLPKGELSEREPSLVRG